MRRYGKRYFANMRKEDETRRYTPQHFVVFNGGLIFFDWSLDLNIGRNANPAFYRFRERPNDWIPLNMAGKQYLESQKG